MQNRFFSIQNRTGPPVLAGDTRIRVTSQVLQLLLPGGHGGLIWNRPASVTVQTGDGPERTIPVVDVTRVALAGIAVCATIAFLLIVIAFSPRRPSEVARV